MILSSVLFSLSLWVLIMFLIFLLTIFSVFLYIKYKKNIEKTIGYNNDFNDTRKFLGRAKAKLDSSNFCYSMIIGSNSLNIISKNGICEKNLNTNFVLHQQNIIINPINNDYNEQLIAIENICLALQEDRYSRPLDNIIICMKAQDLFLDDNLQRAYDISDAVKKISLVTGMKLPCYFIITDCHTIEAMNFLNNIENKNQVVGTFLENNNWNLLRQEFISGINNIQYYDSYNTMDNINFLNFLDEKLSAMEKKLLIIFNSPMVFCRGVFFSNSSNFQNTPFSQNFCQDLITNRIFVERFLAEVIEQKPIPFIKNIKNIILRIILIIISGLFVEKSISTIRSYNAVYSLSQLRNISTSNNIDFEKFSKYINNTSNSIKVSSLTNLVIPKYVYGSFIKSLQQYLFKLYNVIILNEKKTRINNNINNIIYNFSKDNSSQPLDMIYSIINVNNQIKEYNGSLSLDKTSNFSMLYEKIISLDPSNNNIILTENISPLDLEYNISKLEQIFKINLTNWIKTILPYKLLEKGNSLIENMKILEEFIYNNKNLSNNDIKFISDQLLEYNLLISNSNMSLISNTQISLESQEYYIKLKEAFSKQSLISESFFLKTLLDAKDILLSFRQDLLKLTSITMGGSLFKENPDNPQEIIPSERLLQLNDGMKFILQKFIIISDADDVNIINIPQNKSIRWKEENIQRMYQTLKNKEDIFKNNNDLISDITYDIIKKIIFDKSVSPMWYICFKNYDIVNINSNNLKDYAEYWNRNLPYIIKIIEILGKIPEATDIYNQLRKIVRIQLDLFFSSAIQYIDDNYVYKNYTNIKNWTGNENVCQLIFNEKNIDEMKILFSKQFNDLKYFYNTTLSSLITTINDQQSNEIGINLEGNFLKLNNLREDIFERENGRANVITLLEKFYLDLQNWQLISILNNIPTTIKDINNIFYNYINEGQSLLYRTTEKLLLQATQEQLNSMKKFFIENIKGKFPFNLSSSEEVNINDIQKLVKSIDENSEWILKSIQYFSNKNNKDMTEELYFMSNMCDLKKSFNNNNELVIQGEILRKTTEQEDYKQFITSWSFDIENDKIIEYNKRNNKFIWTAGNDVVARVYFADNCVNLLDSNNKKFYEKKFEGSWALVKMYHFYKGKNNNMTLEIPVTLTDKTRKEKVVLSFTISNIPLFHEIAKSIS